MTQQLKDGQQVEFFAGLDLGQTNDYTALVVLQRSYFEDEGVSRAAASFQVPIIRRWPLGTKYTEIVRDVKAGLEDPFFRVERVRWNGGVDTDLAPITLIVDGSGVGRGVVDLFQEAGLRCQFAPVTITGGSTATYTDGYQRVPKVELVSTVAVALQNHMLKVASGLKDATTLLKELQDFRLKKTLAANETYSAREGAHDDLVLSTALALWHAKRDTFEPFDVDSPFGRALFDGDRAWI